MKLMTDVGFTGGGRVWMVYLAGKASHKMSNEMIDHIVQLVEKVEN